MRGTCSLTDQSAGGLFRPSPILYIGMYYNILINSSRIFKFVVPSMACQHGIRINTEEKAKVVAATVVGDVYLNVALNI